MRRTSIPRRNINKMGEEEYYEQLIFVLGESAISETDTSEEISSAWTSVWSPLQADAWRLPERLTPSEWADKYRILDPVNCAEPGPWNTARTPYLREVMDSLDDPTVEHIVIKKSTQVGGTEVILNHLLYAIDQKPGPIMLLYPTEDIAKKVSFNRVKPAILHCNRIKQQLPKNTGAILTEMEYRLPLCTIHFAYSNSPASLGSTPIRYLYRDETNKFKKFTGREASPMKLSSERTRTFWNRKIIDTSTPTDEEGYISVEYNASDRRSYHIPCPKCGHYQKLIWPRVVFPDSMSAEEIRAAKSAWYSCEKCEYLWNDLEKVASLQRGVWCPEGNNVLHNGTIDGLMPKNCTRGYHINCLMSPWLRFCDIAAEFLESKDSPEKLMNFVNSWLGEEWIEKVADMKVEYVENELVSEYDMLEVPLGVLMLTVGVDIQKESAYITVYGWGEGEECWLINCAHVGIPYFHDNGWPNIDEVLFNTVYRIPRFGIVTPTLVFVDSGYRQDEVYSWCRKRIETCYPTKGWDSLPGNPQKVTAIDRHPLTGQTLPAPLGLSLTGIDTNYYKTKLFRILTVPEGSSALFHIPKNTPKEFMRQLTAEHKVITRNSAGKPVSKWQLKHVSAANHYLDATVCALAAAERARVYEIKTPQDRPRNRELLKVEISDNIRKNERRMVSPNDTENEDMVLRRGDGWIKDVGSDWSIR